MRDAFEIFITLPYCITLTLMVRDEDVIGDIKALIARTTRFDIRDMCLTHCSKILDDRHTVGGYMITRMSALGTTFMRLRGEIISGVETWIVLLLMMTLAVIVKH